MRADARTRENRAATRARLPGAQQLAGPTLDEVAGSPRTPPFRDVWPLTATVADNGHLLVGGCDTVTLARKHGTPLYVIDEETFRTNCRRYLESLAKHYPGDGSVYYASKACLNTAIAQLVIDAGLGLDVASAGELYIAMRAGADPGKIHFHGNGKSRSALEYALSLGVGRIIVDSLDELDLLLAITAASAGCHELSFRFTPGVSVATHGHIQTGQSDSKFGMSREDVVAAAERLRNTRSLRLSGLHFHLGSQITDAIPFREAVARTLEVAGLLRERFNILIEEVSPGGGLAAAYTPEENAADIDSFIETVATEIARHARDRSLPLPMMVLEPGRSVVARSGVALYEIVSTKPLGYCTDGSATRFLTIDGGMADNIRPALYGARYTAILANEADATLDDIAHIAGCYCESGDILIRDARVSKSARRGDIVSVAAAGAYTLSMASNYNGALRPEVVLVTKGRVRLIQRRETLEELVRRDESLVLP